MRYRRVLALGIVMVAVLVAGCWDRREIEDQAYVILLGLDRSEGDQLLVTALVGIAPQLTAGAMHPPVSPERVVLGAQPLTARAATIQQAILIMNGASTRQLDLRHLRAVVVGEELAKDGLEPVLLEMQRHPRGRGTAFLAQAKGKAFDVLTALAPVSEINPARMVEGFILQAKSLHLAPPVRLHHFRSRLAATGGDPFVGGIAVNPDVAPDGQMPATGRRGSALPGELPRGGGNPVELAGTAVYRRDRLVGFLNVDETQMFLAMRGGMGKAYITFPDPENPSRPVTMRYHQENLPKRTATFGREGPRVDVRLLFEGELLAAPGGTNYALPDNRERLERAAAAFAERTAKKVIEKLIGWEADPVGFGQLFRGKFGTKQAWEQYDWDARIKDLQVSVDFEMRIRRYGLYMGPDRASDGR